MWWLLQLMRLVISPKSPHLHLGNKVEKTEQKKRKGGRRLQKAMKLSLGLFQKTFGWFSTALSSPPLFFVLTLTKHKMSFCWRGGFGPSLHWHLKFQEALVNDLPTFPPRYWASVMVPLSFVLQCHTWCRSIGRRSSCIPFFGPLLPELTKNLVRLEITSTVQSL